MRKEVLLAKKHEATENMSAFAKMAITEETLKMFSLTQIAELERIIAAVEESHKKASAFVALSATEVMQKESGKIAIFEEEGIREESEDEILRSASRAVYLHSKKED